MKRVAIAAAMMLAVGSAGLNAASAATVNIGTIDDVPPTNNYSIAQPTGPVDYVQFALSPAAFKYDVSIAGTGNFRSDLNFTDADLEVSLDGGTTWAAIVTTFIPGGLSSTSGVRAFDGVVIPSVIGAIGTIYRFVIAHAGLNAYGGAIDVVLNRNAPVPLPGALPMLLAGLGGLGALAWRRKKA